MLKNASQICNELTTIFRGQSLEPFTTVTLDTNSRLTGITRTCLRTIGLDSWCQSSRDDQGQARTHCQYKNKVEKQSCKQTQVEGSRRIFELGTICDINKNRQNKRCSKYIISHELVYTMCNKWTLIQSMSFKLILVT